MQIYYSKCQIRLERISYVFTDLYTVQLIRTSVSHWSPKLQALGIQIDYYFLKYLFIHVFILSWLPHQKHFFRGWSSSSTYSNVAQGNNLVFFSFNKSISQWKIPQGKNPFTIFPPLHLFALARQTFAQWVQKVSMLFRWLTPKVMNCIILFK